MSLMKIVYLPIFDSYVSVSNIVISSKKIIQIKKYLLKRRKTCEKLSFTTYE